jgi:DHA1 family bicyclomycin/chloramphenicol resistance-like MFS transporter
LLDWRAIFAALGLFGTVMLIAIMFGMEETRTEAVAARARTESPLRAYVAAVSNPQVLGYVLTNGLIYAGLFAWITAAPYLIITKYKVPPFWFGWIFGALALGITLSAQANRRLLRSHPADRLMGRGALVAVSAGILLFAAAASGTGGLLGILIPLFFVLAMLGFVATNAVAGGLAADPRAPERSLP